MSIDAVKVGWRKQGRKQHKCLSVTSEKNHDSSIFCRLELWVGQQFNQRDLIMTLEDRALSRDFFLWAICYVSRHLFEEWKREWKQTSSKIIFDVHLSSQRVAESWLTLSLGFKNLSFRNMTFSISFLSPPLFLPNNLHQEHGNLFSYNSTDLAAQKESHEHLR